MRIRRSLDARARRRFAGISLCAALIGTGIVVTAAPASAVGTTIIARRTALGLVLTNASGRVVYLFTRDTVRHSNCSSTCAKTWPRVLTTGAPRAGSGITQAKLSQTATHQVTYNGHPLYYYVGDRVAGQPSGQGRSGLWWVVSPQGNAGTGTPIHLAQTTLGGVVVAPNGRTLYLLSSDGANQTTCYAACATNWPPLITTGRPLAGTGLTAALLGTALRTNGTRQVTYNGHPLYYFVGDAAPGETYGENVFAFGGYWYAVTAAGVAG